MSEYESFLGNRPMARLIAAHDWAATPLGALEGWPPHLRTVVSLVCRSPVAMALMWGPEGTLIYNDAYAVIAADRHPAALGHRALDVWPDVAAFNEDVLRCGLAGDSLSLRDQPFTLRRRGAVEMRWFDLDYSPVCDAEGVPAGVLGLVIETTARAQASSDLERAEARNRQILDSAIDSAIVAFDLDGRVTRWNQGARHLLGWSEPEMLGQDAARIFTAEDRAAGRIAEEMRQALASGASAGERWHLRKSGERFWASSEMTPLRGDSGAPVGFVKVLRDRTEQHRAAQTLREADERLRRAQDVGGVGTFTVDMRSNRVFGTPQFYKIFGLPQAESVPALQLEALVLPEDAAVRSGPATREDRSAPLDVEYRIRRADDGALRWISRKASFEAAPDGTAVRMVGIVQDVTERKAALQAVEDSAAQFRLLAESLPDHVWTATPGGVLDWVNQRGLAYVGTAADRLAGVSWSQHVHPDDRDAAGLQWDASVAAGRHYETEFRIRRADGAMRWHLVRALPLRTADGAVVRWIGTNTDIHERKLAEAQTTRERERIWSLSQELMLTCDLDGVILAVNPAATRILGWAGEEMVGQPLSAFIHPDDAAATAREVERLAHGHATLSFENRYRRRDGLYRVLSWTAVPDSGLIHGIARDVTRERATEEALRQSQKLEAIGQLTGGVAHDFNNVLAVIQTSIELLKRLPLDDPRRPRFMDAIANSVTRGTKLTGQLLAFARRQALQPVVFDAAENVRAVLDMINSLTGARVQTALQLPGHPCFVNADPNQFDTALVNLAVNARDAMQGNGQMTIAVSAVDGIPQGPGGPVPPGPFVAVSVSDSGSGIAPEHLAQIFEPFFTTKGVGAGTGLGLSQVFGFAKQSGGDIQVQSTPGQGSRFTLYLPREAHDSTAAELQVNTGPLAMGNGACVLVVEDNAEVAASVVHMLAELGYRTHHVTSAEDALAELARNVAAYAAVFSDVMMSGMSGIEMGHEIRRRHPQLPVVLSSGYSAVLAQRTDHGFALLSKPYAMSELSHVLHDAIRHHRAEPQQLRRVPLLHVSTAPTPVPAAYSEPARLAALAALQVMDTAPEAAYDELTRVAAEFFQAPIALISLVDDTRQWFKSRVGLQTAQTPREVAFCAHAIQQPGQIMVVPDALDDARFATNPLVTGDPNIRFYVGAPLVTSAGQALGTLCVIDTQPRQIQPGQVETLKFLASEVIQRLEQRRATPADGQPPRAPG